MPGCAIITCRARSAKATLANGGITFHRFPKDPLIKNKWIEATGRKNWFPTKHSRICSVHFHEDSFTGPSKYRRLISTAYPTIDVVIMSNNEKLQDNPVHAGPSREGVSKDLWQSDEDGSNSDSTTSVPPKGKGQLSLEQCRFCGEFNKDCVTVTSEKPYLVNNRTSITMNGLTVDLDFNNTLPKTVCRYCDGKLQELHDFVKQVKTAQDTLIEVAEESREDIETLIIKTESPTLEDDKEGILDSVTGESDYEKHTVFTHKRKSESDREGVKKQKAETTKKVTARKQKAEATKKVTVKNQKNPVVDKKESELIVDIKEEVMEKDESVGIENENSDVCDTGPSELDVATSALLSDMTGDQTSELDVATSALLSDMAGDQT